MTLKETIVIGESTGHEVGRFTGKFIQSSLLRMSVDVHGGITFDPVKVGRLMLSRDAFALPFHF